MDDAESLPSPPADIDKLIADAFAQRPEILALEFESQSAEKLHNAAYDEEFPTISALARSAMRRSAMTASMALTQP